MGFASKLKELRTAGGLSLRELAVKLKVNHAYLSRLENEAVRPSDKIIRQVAVLFKVPKGELELYAGKLPADVSRIFYQHPKEAVFLLREQFAVYNTKSANGSNGRSHRESAICKLVFETDLGKLYHGDCLDLLPTIPSESVDCVFADPPFNLNKHYGERVDDNLAESHYLKWSYQWLGELCRVLKSGGSLFVYNLPKWNIYYATFLSQQLDFRHWIAINIKTTLPIPGRLYPSHYSLLYLTKGKATTFVRPRVPIPQCRHCGGDIKDYGGHRKWLNPAGLNLTDVWDDIPPVRHQKYKSRTANELSTKLLERVLGMSTVEGDLVLDPFGGGGTTYYVAETMGRRWIGCEIESCQPIIKRLKSDLFTGHKAEELVAVG